MTYKQGVDVLQKIKGIGLRLAKVSNLGFLFHIYISYVPQHVAYRNMRGRENT